MRRRLCLPLALAALLAAHGTRAAEEIALGFANPLSGPYATSGDHNRTAVELAADDLNRTGGLLGRRVRVVAVDDACGVERAQAAAQELVEAGVVAVVGHFCSHSSLVAAAVYEAAGVPMISPDSTHPRLTEEGRGDVFRLTGRGAATGSPRPGPRCRPAAPPAPRPGPRRRPRGWAEATRSRAPGTPPRPPRPAPPRGVR